jgi:hypothetical protein
LVYVPRARLITEYGEPSERALKVRVPAWETMAESVLLSTRAVPTGSCRAAAVACLALDITATPPVAVATARITAAASAQVFRLTG